MNGWLRWSLNGLWVATVFQVGFVLVYGFGPWRRHFVGRALFFKSTALALVLAVTLVNAYVTYAWQIQVGTILIWLVALAIVYQFAALLWQRYIDRSS